MNNLIKIMLYGCLAVVLICPYASAQTPPMAPFPSLPPSTPPPDYTSGSSKSAVPFPESEIPVIYEPYQEPEYQEPESKANSSSALPTEEIAAPRPVLRGNSAPSAAIPVLTTPKQDDSRPEVLIKLENQKGKSLSKDKKLESVALRPQVQKEAALSAGIKAGVKYRYQQILDEVVEPNKTELDMLFNFTPLLITQGEVVATPPVIARAGAALRVGDDGIVSFQKGSHKFINSANIITGVPTWRNYLNMNIAEPEELHPSIFPTGGKEIKKWKAWVNEGWKIGIEQADLLFESNVAKLVRDYKGMLIYYGLAAEGLVEKPVIKTTPTGTHIMTKEVIYERTLYQVTQDGKFRKPPPLPKTSGYKGQTKKAAPKKSAPKKAAQAQPTPKIKSSAETTPKQPKQADQGDCVFARSKNGGATSCP